MPIMNYFLLSSFFTLFCLLFLSVFIACDHTFSKRINMFFRMAIFMIFALLVTDSARIYFSHLSYYTIQHKIATVFGYVIRPICAGVVLALSMKNTRRNHIIVLSIIGLNTVIILLNFIGPVSFSIDSTNTFHREPLWFIPYVSSISLMIGILISATIRLHTNPRKSALAFGIIFSVSFATYLEAMDIAYLMIPATGAISILFYYLSLNVDTYKRDTLTKLYNRRNFDMDCHHYRHSPMIIATLDLNDLKYYNDTFGHKTGDEALLTVVEGMKKCLESIGTLYRTGGDEFMVIFRKKSLQSVEEAFKKFDEFMAATKYRAAFGFAQYNPGKSGSLDEAIENTITISDQKMYENKKSQKC